MRYRWECPNCTVTAASGRAAPPFHPCRGLRGLAAPMTREGTRARVRSVDRDDYVAGELVQTDGNGRPVMAVVTDRDDGMDCAVLAPTAQTMGEQHGD